ncbi:hypothetical protein JCM10212_004692 [Sporobolomyces blumeae]
MSTEAMRAWVFRRKGPPRDVLHLESDYPVPRPTTPSQVLLSVKAVSLNPVGWKMMGVAPIKWLSKVPGVPESDVAGVVVKGGRTLTEGQKVYGIKPAEKVARDGKGVLAEYAVVDEDHLRPIPRDVSFERAAATPLAANTALFALCDTAGLERGKGQKVFVNGGSGGVGAFAVQIAQSYGADVYTTCSPASRQLVESLVRDPSHIFDYQGSTPLEDQLTRHVKDDKKEFDIVFDAIGVPSLYHASEGFLKKSGVYLDIAGPHLDGTISNLVYAAWYVVSSLARPKWLGGVARKYKFVSMQVKQHNVDEMTRLLSDGSIDPVVDSTYEFEQALEAYDKSMSGRAKGKVVVTLPR